MDRASPQLIRLVLLDGSPEGLRTAQATGRTTQVLVGPVTRLAEIRKRPEADRPALYVLAGDTLDSDQKLAVYIGECDTFAGRFQSKHHAWERADWRLVFIITTADGAFNKAHARHAEYELVTRARSAERAVVMTESIASGRLDEGDLAFAGAFVFDAMLLLETLGLEVFRRRSGPRAGAPLVGEEKSQLQPPRDGPPVFVYTVRNAKARMRPAGDEFIILKGSSALSHEAPSIPDQARRLRAEARASGVLVSTPDLGLLSFQRDFAVPSVSAAAKMVAGFIC